MSNLQGKFFFNIHMGVIQQQCSLCLFPIVKTGAASTVGR